MGGGGVSSPIHSGKIDKIYALEIGSTTSDISRFFKRSRYCKFESFNKTIPFYICPSDIDILIYHMYTWFVFYFFWDLTQNVILFSEIPVLHIEYDAIWSFQNVLPKACANITIRLNSSKNTLEEAFLEQCKLLINNYTVQFHYMVLAFKVRKFKIIDMFVLRWTTN